MPDLQECQLDLNILPISVVYIVYLHTREQITCTDKVWDMAHLLYTIRPRSFVHFYKQLQLTKNRQDFLDMQ